MDHKNLTWIFPLLCLWMLACSTEQALVWHHPLPEKNRNNSPTGKFYELECLETGKNYAIQLPQSLIYGEVQFIRRHNKLKGHRLEALKPEDTVRILVDQRVSYTNTCGQKPHEIPIGRYATDTTSVIRNQLCLIDTMFITTVLHGDILSFKEIKDRKYNFSEDCVSGPLTDHRQDYAGQQHDYCPLVMHQLCVFFVSSEADTTHYKMMLGEITEMPYTLAGSSLTLVIRNEATVSRDGRYPDVNSITGLLEQRYIFPENSSAYEKKVWHEDIDYFMPVCSLQDEWGKVPFGLRFKSGFSEGFPSFALYFLSFMLAGLVASLF